MAEESKGDAKVQYEAAIAECVSRGPDLEIAHIIDEFKKRGFVEGGDGEPQRVVVNSGELVAGFAGWTPMQALLELPAAAALTLLKDNSVSQPLINIILVVVTRLKTKARDVAEPTGPGPSGPTMTVVRADELAEKRPDVLARLNWVMFTNASTETAIVQAKLGPIQGSQMAVVCMPHCHAHHGELPANTPPAIFEAITEMLKPRDYRRAFSAAFDKGAVTLDAMVDSNYDEKLAMLSIIDAVQHEPFSAAVTELAYEVVFTRAVVDSALLSGVKKLEFMKRNANLPFAFVIFDKDENHPVRKALWQPDLMLQRYSEVFFLCEMKPGALTQKSDSNKLLAMTRAALLCRVHRGDPRSPSEPRSESTSEPGEGALPAPPSTPVFAAGVGAGAGAGAGANAGTPTPVPAAVVPTAATAATGTTAATSPTVAAVAAAATAAVGAPTAPAAAQLKRLPGIKRRSATPQSSLQKKRVKKEVPTDVPGAPAAAPPAAADGGDGSPDAHLQVSDILPAVSLYGSCADLFLCWLVKVDKAAPWQMHYYREVFSFEGDDSRDQALRLNEILFRAQEYVVKLPAWISRAVRRNTLEAGAGLAGLPTAKTGQTKKTGANSSKAEKAAASGSKATATAVTTALLAAGFNAACRSAGLPKAHVASDFDSDGNLLEEEELPRVWNARDAANNEFVAVLKEMDVVRACLAVAEELHEAWPARFLGGYRALPIPDTELGLLLSPAQAVVPVGDLDDAEILQASSRMVEDLCAMHDRYIMHGDVKPGNVLVLKGGDVRIIDFDCFVRLTPETCNDGVQRYAGTEGYVAPEVEAPRGERRYGLPADVYSCGVALREFAHFVSDGCKARDQLLEAAAKAMVMNPGDRPTMRQLLDDVTVIAADAVRGDSTARCSSPKALVSLTTYDSDFKLEEA